MLSRHNVIGSGNRPEASVSGDRQKESILSDWTNLKGSALPADPKNMISINYFHILFLTMRS